MKLSKKLPKNIVQKNCPQNCPQSCPNIDYEIAHEIVHKIVHEIVRRIIDENVHEIIHKITQVVQTYQQKIESATRKKPTDDNEYNNKFFFASIRVCARNFVQTKKHQIEISGAFQLGILYCHYSSGFSKYLGLSS